MRTSPHWTTALLWHLLPMVYLLRPLFGDILVVVLAVELCFRLWKDRNDGPLRLLVASFPPVILVFVLVGWFVLVAIISLGGAAVPGVPHTWGAAFLRPALLFLLAFVSFRSRPADCLRWLSCTIVLSFAGLSMALAAAEWDCAGWFRLQPVNLPGRNFISTPGFGAFAAFVAVFLLALLLYGELNRRWRGAAGMALLVAILVIGGAGTPGAAALLALGSSMIVLSRLSEQWRDRSPRYSSIAVGLLVICCAFTMWLKTASVNGVADLSPRERPVDAAAYRLARLRPLVGYGLLDLEALCRTISSGASDVSGPGVPVDGSDGDRTSTCLSNLSNESGRKPTAPGSALRTGPGRFVLSDLVTWYLACGLPGLVLYLAMLGGFVRYLWYSSSRYSGLRLAFTEGAAAALLGAAFFGWYAPFWFDGRLGAFAMLVVGVTAAFGGVEIQARRGLDEAGGDRGVSCRARGLPVVAHVNLARGYRGGERQTEMLIKTLSSFGMKQKLIVRGGSPLVERLAGVTGLEIQEIAKPYFLWLFSVEGADIIHAHEAKSAQFAMHTSVVMGKPYLLTRRVTNPVRYNPYNRAVYGWAEVVVCLSRAIRHSVLSSFPSARCTIVPSMSSDIAVDPVRLQSLRRRFHGRFLVGHAGALVTRHKGQDLLISLARRLASTLPDAHFIFLGEGEDRKKLEDMARDLDNVTFEGFVDNIADYLAALDLFVFPSREEGLGSVLLDVMRFGVPVVATEAGGIPDVVIHGETGLLVPVDDVDGLASAVTRLYRDREFAACLAERARVRAGEFEPSVIASKYLAIYRQLVGTGDEVTVTGDDAPAAGGER